MRPYYEAGGITIYHGDAREVQEWRSAAVLVTDPPYGMAYKSWGGRVIAGDEDSQARDAILALWGARPALVFGTWRVEMPRGTRQTITWAKESIGPGMGDLSLPWGPATEECYVLGSGWQGSRRPNFYATAEARVGPGGGSALYGHPTPKPVRLMAWLLECCPPGVVADPFMGVGATLVAAKSLGREAIGVEIEEAYCETAALRVAQEVLAL